MMLQEVRQIWRAINVQSFEGHGGKFKPYTPFSRKPFIQLDSSSFEDSGEVRECWYKPLHAGYVEDEMCA